jgi:NAD(P)-dependent dehydrogenase (short-subunit alcohol dehydrogenase family)
MALGLASRLPAERRSKIWDALRHKPCMAYSIEGRTALVTGAGRGIGRALALQLAQGGARVVLVARSADQLNETAAQVKEFGGNALPIPTDVSRIEEIARTVAHTIGIFGGVDILINNAAVVAPLGPSRDVEPTEWANTLAVNVVAVAAFSVALLPIMLERNWGRIVNVSASTAARPDAMIGMNAYAASKAALEAHTLNLAAEVTGSGVTVNGYRPGSVDTAMQAWIRAQDPERIGRELHDRFTASFASGRLITAEESARSLLSHLDSEDSGRVWDVSEHV